MFSINNVSSINNVLSTSINIERNANAHNIANANTESSNDDDDKSTQVWVEKYRPDNFDDIVLDPLNRKIMENIITQNYFPNLLLYGPPGTGKTTTIINLVNRYQDKNNQRNKGLMIHLNASDERGIDIIRNQINQFVNSQALFHTGTKFVILDEVDYMTKNAQQALKYLLQDFNKTCRFCLICNYISRIDESLQNEFVRLRFNQLPESDITTFLNKISVNEGLHLSKETILSIQKLYKSDIRSMINYIQSNQFMFRNKKVINNEIWEGITNALANDKTYKTTDEIFEKISVEYNIDIKNIIKDYLNYLIRSNKKLLSSTAFLKCVENIVHSIEPNTEYIKMYTIETLHELMTK
jgi:DNA polymerase III delta prime subunit